MSSRTVTTQADLDAAITQSRDCTNRLARLVNPNTIDAVHAGTYQPTPTLLTGEGQS